jgi:hypothetical protein
MVAQLALRLARGEFDGAGDWILQGPIIAANGWRRRGIEYSVGPLRHRLESA